MSNVHEDKTDADQQVVDLVDELAPDAVYLPPIIRRYNKGEFISEHHIQDDLESQWYLEEYVKPARAYFDTQFA